MAALDKALRQIERWLERSAPASRSLARETQEPSPQEGVAAPVTETKH